MHCAAMHSLGHHHVRCARKPWPSLGDNESVCRKGTQIILAEMGDNVRHLKAPDQIALLKEKPNWKLANRKSQIQELFKNRGHFFLIGAA